jgi:hypothetical protein
MAIFAQQSGSGDGQSGGLRLRLSTEVQDGSTLVYDADLGAFVDTLTGGLSITSGKTLGGERAISLLKGKNGSSLEFRELRAGPGIAIDQDATAVTITANADAGVRAVPGSYRIVIDSHDETDDTARLELFTVRSAAQHVSVTASVLPLVVSSAVHTGISLTGEGYFQIINDANFHNRGFRPGMWVRVANALNQSGTYRIGQVLTQNVSGNSLSTLLLDRPFSDTEAYNLGGPKPNVTFEQMDVVVIGGESLPLAYDPALPYRIASASVDFGPLGMDFRPGMLVEIIGSETQDGTYVVAGVTPRDASGYSSLLMDADTPLIGPAVPLAGEITFRVRETEVDTGFSVSEQGHLRATTGVFANGLRIADPAYVPTAAGDIVTKAHLDAAVTGRAARYFYANL